VLSRVARLLEAVNPRVVLVRRNVARTRLEAEQRALAAAGGVDVAYGMVAAPQLDDRLRVGALGLGALLLFGGVEATRRRYLENLRGTDPEGYFFQYTSDLLDRGALAVREAKRDRGAAERRAAAADAAAAAAAAAALRAPVDAALSAVDLLLGTVSDRGELMGAMASQEGLNRRSFDLFAAAARLLDALVAGDAAGDLPARELAPAAVFDLHRVVDLVVAVLRTRGGSTRDAVARGAPGPLAVVLGAASTLAGFDERRDDDVGDSRRPETALDDGFAPEPPPSPRPGAGENYRGDAAAGGGLFRCVDAEGFAAEPLGAAPSKWARLRRHYRESFAVKGGVVKNWARKPSNPWRRLREHVGRSFVVQKGVLNRWSRAAEDRREASFLGDVREAGRRARDNLRELGAMGGNFAALLPLDLHVGAAAALDDGRVFRSGDAAAVAAAANLALLKIKCLTALVCALEGAGDDLRGAIVGRAELRPALDRVALELREARVENARRAAVDAPLLASPALLAKAARDGVPRPRRRSREVGRETSRPARSVGPGALQHPARRAGRVHAEHGAARAAEGPRRAPRAAARAGEPPVEPAHVRVEINRRFGTSRPNFEILELGHIEVDSADFWTDRVLSSSSRSRAEDLASKLSHILALKSG